MTLEEIRAGLEEIKPGDWVALYDRGNISKEQVTKTTKTYIIIIEAKFRRKSGRRSGKVQLWQYIRPWSKDIEQEIVRVQIKQKKSALISKIRIANFYSLELIELKEIALKLGIKIGEEVVK